MFIHFWNCKCSKYLIFVFVSLSSIQKTVSHNNENEIESDTQDRCKKNKDLTISSLRNNGFQNMSFTSQFFENFLTSKISNQCKDSMVIYFNDAINLKPWSIEMLDASGKIPSSFFGGTIIDYGSMEDCINIKVHSNLGNKLFKGKFCMVSLRHPLFQTPHRNPYIGKKYDEAFGVPPNWIRSLIENDISLRFGFYGGICMPSTCTDDDLYNILKAFAEPLDLDVTLTDCQVEESPKMTVSAKFVCIFLGVLLLSCVSGTILDLNDRKKKGGKLKFPGESLFKQLLKAFSLYSNVEELFTVSTKKVPLDCIHGFRLIFCMWIMSGHTMVIPTLWKELRYRNFHLIHEFMDKKMVMYNNGPTVVNCFFTISAFLLVYTSWKKLEQSEGRINVLENIIQKYCRLTPAHIFVILLSFLMPTFSSGPIWNTSWERELENCYNNGWKNLLYIQNYDGVLDVCMVHSWYLASTMQFLIISLPLMIATYRYPKAGVFLGLILYFGPVIHYYYMSLELQFPFIAYNSFRHPHVVVEVLSKIYFLPSFHISSNIIGMLFGWLFLKYGERKLPKMWIVIGWSLGILCLVYGQFAVYIPTKDFRIMAFYNTTRNSAMSLGICWLIYACASGQGGVFDKLCSMKALVPFSRISYCIYLVHPLYVIFRDASNADRYYMDKLTHAVDISLYFVVSTIGGFLAYILVEEPFNKIYNLLKKRKRSSTAPPNDSTKIGSSTVLNENETNKH